MMADRFNVLTDILHVSMQATVLRNDVINNNIANVDTPRFKRSEVAFEEALRRAIQRSRATGTLDLSNVRPEVRFVNAHLSSRIDGNNVDIEAEMAALVTNSVRFDTMVQGVMSNYRQLNLVLNMR